MVKAGVLCTINTDDPAMFDTDLSREHEAASELGYTPRAAFQAGLHGALCGDELRGKLRRIFTDHDWPVRPGEPTNKVG
jgi:aminodeoxyfutalosine deaminase